MNSDMRAVVFVETGRFEVRTVPVPRPESGELLIRVEAAGICHTDHDILAGRYAAEFPRIPGHEFAGTVVAVGDASLKRRLGERVAVDPLVSCGSCRNCVRGFPNLCLLGRAYGAELDGGFAEYASVRAENAFDAGALPSAAAALGEPFACVVNALDRANLTGGEHVAVIGAGPMGMMLTLGLRGRGVQHVTVADRLTERLDQARRFGATQTAIVDGPLSRSLGSRDYDLVIDATGRPQVVKEAVGLLADAGTLIPFGVCPPGSELTLDPNEIYRRQLRIIGSFSLARGMPSALRILGSSEYPVHELGTTVFGLDEAANALAAVGGADTIKVQFDPQRNSNIQRRKKEIT